MKVVRWVGVNVGLFLVASLVLIMGWGLINRALGNEPPGVLGRALFAWGLFLGLLLPFLAVYLVIIALLPSGWSERTQRVAAVGVGLVAMVVLLLAGAIERPDGPAEAAVTCALFALPGVIVRLPWRKTPPGSSP